MPSIAEFLGMAFYMYWDKQPPAHFHLRFGSMWASINVQTGEIVDGAIPRKKLKKSVNGVDSTLKSCLRNGTL